MLTTIHEKGTVAGAQALAAGEAFEVRATAAGVMYQEEDEAGTVATKNQTAEEERDPVRKSQRSGFLVKADVDSKSTWTDAYVGEISAEGTAEVAAMNASAADLIALAERGSVAPARKDAGCSLRATSGSGSERNPNAPWTRRITMALIVCMECGGNVSSSATNCPACGYPVQQMAKDPRQQKPRSSTGEETVWEGRASLRSALPHFFKFFLSVTLVVVLFQVGLARAPEWACKASKSASEAVDSALFTKVWGYAFTLELAILVLLLLGLLKSILVVKSIYVKLTNQRLISEYGILSKQVDDIDLRIVDDTQFSQGVLDRLLKIGTVTVISNDMTSPRLYLRGFDSPRELRERIRAQVYAYTQHQHFVRST